MNPNTLSKPANGRVRRSLTASFLDGLFAQIQFSLTDQFITPLALFFGANNVAIGFLSFIRNALVSIIQVYSSELTLLLGSRKRLITISVFLAALMWLPTFFLPILFSTIRVHLFIVLFAITSSLNLLATPAWASLMSEYIPSKKRGKYFGFRGTALGFVYLFSLLFGGILLHVFERADLFSGFCILIILASVTRLVSWYFLTQMYEPKWQVSTVQYFSIYAFLKRFPQSNFARYAVFAAAFMFGVAIVSPFFAVYLLVELNYNYLNYTILSAAAVTTMQMTQRYWGKYADRYGNHKIITMTSTLISVVPLFWIFSSNFYYLLIIQLLSGFLWAGLNLTSVNFIYDAAIAQKRERCISYFNFLSGLGLGVGALLGGFFYRVLPPFGGSIFFSMLVISTVLRFIFAHCVIFFTKEVRAVEKVETRILILDIAGVRGLGLLGQELLVRTRKKVFGTF